MDSATPQSTSRVAERRIALGLTREALAAQAGVSMRTIERIESGLVEPRRATLAVVEAALSKVEADPSQTGAAA